MRSSFVREPLVSWASLYKNTTSKLASIHQLTHIPIDLIFIDSLRIRSLVLEISSTPALDFYVGWHVFSLSCTLFPLLLEFFCFFFSFTSLVLVFLYSTRRLDVYIAWDKFKESNRTRCCERFYATCWLLFCTYIRNNLTWFFSAQVSMCASVWWILCEFPQIFANLLFMNASFSIFPLVKVRKAKNISEFWCGVKSAMPNGDIRWWIIADWVDGELLQR